MTDHLNGSEIAIIGMACRFPGARNLGEFWQNLRDGVESVTRLEVSDIEPNDLDPTPTNDPAYVRAAALLDDVELFDAAFFGITPKEAAVMDPQQRVFLECAWEALEHAGHSVDTYRERVALYAGARTNTYLLNVFADRELFEAVGAFQVGLGNDLAFLSTRVSHRLNLKGPSCSVHTACSTSLVAVHMACQSLLIGEAEMALAGGVAINVPQRVGYVHRDGGIASPDGHCRAFDAKAAGTIFGSGVGIVVLKRLEDAIEGGDRIHAVIKGSSINNDGSTKASFTAPSVRGQTEVVAEALANAEIQPASVSYVEAHGTATALGDAIEMQALGRVFDGGGDRPAPCAIGSVKTNFGHLDAAAGIAGLIKTALALEHLELPPSLHFETPNPNVDFGDGLFEVNTELRDWPESETPRRAGVSSFGVGGTNAHVVLEEAPPPPLSGSARPSQVVTLSAKSASALERAAENLANAVEAHPDETLADTAYTLAVGRAAFGYRRAVVTDSNAELVSALRGEAPERVLEESYEGEGRSVVFLFPGQGTQYVNMGHELYRSEPYFRQELERCSALLESELGVDLLSLLYPEGELSSAAREALDQTAITQPALFAIEYSLARLWMSWGVRPRAMIGHSSGEYVAACLSGVFSLEDALRLVVARGRMMNQLPGGSMLAVPMSEEELAGYLGQELSLAAVNASSLCVASGSHSAIEALEQELAAKGTACRRLQTSHAFHSHMMEPIVGVFANKVKRVARDEPQIPYISNVTGTWITTPEATSPEYWARHLRQTVRFDAGLEELLSDEGSALLEVGPGPVLSRLAKRHPDCGRERPVAVSMTDADGSSSELMTALAGLWVASVPIDWQAVYSGQSRLRMALPSYPFERQRYWVDGGRSAQRASGAVSGKQADVADWFHLPSWRRSLLPLAAQVEPEADDARPWWIFIDEGGLGEPLVERLRAAGREVVAIRAGTSFEDLGGDEYVISPHGDQDYLRLAREVRARSEAPRKVIHLWSVDVRTGDQASFESIQERGYYSLLYLVRALALEPLTEPMDLWVVSSGLEVVESQDTVVAEQATLQGVAAVIPQEMPTVSCCTVDLSAEEVAKKPAALAERLWTEFAGTPREAEIALRGARRWVRSHEPVRIEKEDRAARPLRDGGVYLLTGGWGGAGMLVAENLAREVGAKLILTGRSPFPERAEWERCLEDTAADDAVAARVRWALELEEHGAEVMGAVVDVADEAKMRDLVDTIEGRFGRLDGVFHLAGITSGTSIYRPISEIGPGESMLQFGPKATGVYVLERVLAGREVDFCVLFSSMATVLGGMGYAAYAAANRFMDAFAESRVDSDSTSWICANWDPWPEETKRYEGVQTSVDRYAMTPEESFDAVARLATSAVSGQIVVATGDLEARYQRWRLGGLSPTGGKETTVQMSEQPRPSVSSEFVAPRNEVEAKIAEIWQDVLGIGKVGVDDNFFDLGGHSLLMITIQGQLREALETEVSMVDLFTYPTIGTLAEAVSRGGGDEPMFDQVDERAERQAAAINRQRALRQGVSGAAGIEPATASANGKKSSILKVLAQVTDAENGAAALNADDDLKAFGHELVERFRDRAESILYYPHPFNRGGFVVVLNQEADVLGCMVDAYAGAPPDVMVYCLHRSDLRELSYPGLFVPPDVNGKPHLSAWLRYKGALLSGTDVREEVPPLAVDPELLLDGHLAGCVLSLRSMVLGKLMEEKYLSLVQELDRQVRYLMGTALLTRERWDISLATLPDEFGRHFPHEQLEESFDQLTVIRRRMETREPARDDAFDAVWHFESFIRQMRSYVS